jgi:hypothetical protein
MTNPPNLMAPKASSLAPFPICDDDQYVQFFFLYWLPQYRIIATNVLHSNQDLLAKKPKLCKNLGMVLGLNIHALTHKRHQRRDTTINLVKKLERETSI